jgi:hypothetical protein
MNTPYGLEIIENCQACKIKREDCFCNLSPPVLKHFSAISHQTTFPAEPRCSWRGKVHGEFSCCARARSSCRPVRGRERC